MPAKTATPVPPTPTPVYPIRINFGSGQTTAVVSGFVGPNATPQYLVYAQAGQRMRILLDSPSPAANFSVQGVFDGLLYKTPGDMTREWYFNVPRSQDYLITITAPVNTSFTLEVILTGGSAPTATPVTGPERISFDAGATSAVRSGAVAGGQARQYIFRAQAGQEARLLLASTGGAANFALRGVTDGVVYKTLSNSAREVSLVLPRTQDYLITIASPVSTYYTLELTIAPLAPTPVPTHIVKTPTPTPTHIVKTPTPTPTATEGGGTVPPLPKP